jgi:single-strand DNA-binding protein
MNKVILIGNLTKDPELTVTNGGVSVCRFSIAVGRDFKNADGEKETDFFNVVVWRGQAENCNKYLKKGNKVCVVGAIHNRSFVDNDGTKKLFTDIQADQVEFLTPKSSDDGEGKDFNTDDVKPVENNAKVEKTDKGNKEEVASLQPIDDDSLPF